MRRRQAGEGSISEYRTVAGPRYLIKYAAVDESGVKKMVLRRRDSQGQPMMTRKAAAEELRRLLTAVAENRHVSPNRVTVAQHFGTWLDGLRKEPSTVASYRKNVRLHVLPYLGDAKLSHLTGTRLTKLYRELERSGRADGKGGLSPRTVRYIHTILHAGLSAAVRDGLLATNPADKADPPTAKAAAAPEMRNWTAGELRAFLDHARDHGDELATLWTLLAATGMRRGEALGLRWGDVDLDAGRLSVRRAATTVNEKGIGSRTIVGPPKSGKPRTVDLDPDTVTMLKAHKAAQGSFALSLARDDSYVMCDLDGGIRRPEGVSRRFERAVARARRDLGQDRLTVIRLHDLRHTHATLLLAGGIPVKVVSERLGHASATITLGVYAHVMPGMQAEAASKFAALMGGTSC